jgi:hypothetical protein
MQTHRVEWAKGDKIMNSKGLAAGSIIVAGAVLVAFIWFALEHVFGKADFGAVAVLILVALAAFIGIMNVLSISAHLIGITDAKEPFGLPDGTVRAILTMAFIVLVGVLASYLLTNSTARAPYGAPIVMKGIAAKDADATVQRLSADGIVSVERGADPNAPVNIQFLPKQDYRLADDVAKQILTMLSTILAAMIGFYFGAQSPSAKPDDSAERASIQKELDGLDIQAKAVRTAADAKLAADATKRPQIDPIKASLTEIDNKIAAARTAANNPSVPIEKVRGALAEAKTAAAGLEALKQRVDAA